jgi:hypothetical protein
LLELGLLSGEDLSEEMLAQVLRTIGHAVPLTGLAALRFWGQTGERSGAWMAAADPVHLEARLNHVFLHAFHGDDVSRSDLRELFKSLQEILGGDERFALARLGPLAYLRSDQPIATAAVSPAVVDGLPPDNFMPAGDSAAAHDLLVSELQMALHDHAINQSRALIGERTVNSIWLWGGGTAPDQEVRKIPPLIGDDPLFRGYWCSCTGVMRAWNGSLDEASNFAPDGFVAVAPQELDSAPPEAITDCLETLRVMLKRGDLLKLTLLFRDGLRIEIEKKDAFRFWRKVSPLLLEENADE